MKPAQEVAMYFTEKISPEGPASQLTPTRAAQAQKQRIPIAQGHRHWMLNGKL